MNALYTILFTSTNAASQERINLGLVMLDNSGQLLFRYSHEKLTLAKRLLSDDGYRLVKSYLSSIEARLTDKINISDSRSSVHQSYLEYLSNYSNNLVSFTKPQQIDIPLDQSTFDKVFAKFVFKSTEKTVEPSVVSDMSLVKATFIPKVEKRVNVDIELKADELDFIVFNQRIDMIGENERPVLNQFVDFDSSPSTLKQKINNYISLIKPFDLYSGKESKFFMVGDEPAKTTPQHQVWKHLKESTLISKGALELVTSQELEKLELYLEEHNVRPFFEPKQP
jgi:hypothetical protein